MRFGHKANIYQSLQVFYENFAFVIFSKSNCCKTSIGVQIFYQNSDFSQNCQTMSFRRKLFSINHSSFCPSIVYSTSDFVNRYWHYYNYYNCSKANTGYIYSPQYTTHYQLQPLPPFSHNFLEKINLQKQKRNKIILV